MDNTTIARRLLSHANTLQPREAHLYRIRAYRRAAEAIGTLTRPAEEILAVEGPEALRRMPGIGSHLAYTIEHLIRTGELRTLTRARPLATVTAEPTQGATCYSACA